MSKNRIFVISWDFPPTFTGESIVCYKTLRYSKHSYDVCSNNPNPTYKKYVYAENINAIRVDGGNLKWSVKVLNIFLNMDKVNDYKVFESRVMPSIGHFTGFLIKLFKPRIKWVVYFSDPIWNSPYCNLLDQLKGKVKKQPSFYVMLYSSIFSWIAIRMGDKLVFNNEYLARHVLGKSYKKFKKKVSIAPYGFDKVAFKNIMPIYKIKDKLLISHVGQIYGARNFNIIIAALEKMKITYPESYARIIIRQIGHISSEEKMKIVNSNVQEAFKLIGTVDFKCSLEYMKSSDYLLTIDALFNELEYNLYIPSKIFDYIGARKPIVAISQSIGPSADIIRNTENVLIEHDSEAMLSFFMKIVDGITKEPDYNKYDFYDCERGVKVFDEIFDKFLK